MTSFMRPAIHTPVCKLRRFSSPSHLTNSIRKTDVSKSFGASKDLLDFKGIAMFDPIITTVLWFVLLPNLQSALGCVVFGNLVAEIHDSITGSSLVFPPIATSALGGDHGNRCHDSKDCGGEIHVGGR
jgi:hypothetical protein